MSQLDEWVWAIERLPALLDGAWLEAEVARVAAAVAADTSGGRRDRRKFHPLAELTYHVRRELQARHTPAFRPTPSIAKLGTVCLAIQRLRERAVEGLDDRVSRLTGSSAADFESTRFEIEIAALHVVLGHHVHFVQEQPGRRTPDLVVDDAFEVECKKKVELSQRDRAMRDTWAFLKRRLYEILTGPGAYLVEFLTAAAPTRADVDWAVAEVKRIVGKTSAPFDAKIVEAIEGRELRFCTLEATSDGRGVKVDLPSDARPLDSFDVGKLEITAKLDGGAMRPWLALQFGFSTNDHKDWLDGVRDSLRTARGQLSGERPGLVFIEAPAAARASKDGRLGAVKQVIDTAFRTSSRLSAVAICFTGWDDAAAEAVTQYHVERNPAARLPVAANYYVSDVREEWRRTTGRNDPCPCGSGTKFKRCCLA